ncbi:MAG: hypothetical protein WAV22_00230 [Porticoccaceae bacterium]
MNTVQRSVRRFFCLAFSGCLLGLSMSSHTQELTITPAAPEAYQPFTLDQFFDCTPIVDPDVIRVDVSPATHSIHLDADVPDGCFATPPSSRKVANVPGLPSGTYSIRARVHYWDPVEPPEIGSVAITPAPPTHPVFAFYNSDIRHYFITAGVSEKDSLLGGGGGGGWNIVDGGFRAWPAAGPAPAAAKPVCRFYSSLVNSHFYTAGANECEMLKQPGSGWTYEGIAFRALVPIKGSCYPGTTPVWRLYNDRFAQADSNHRFIASADTYRHMIGNGWVGEGVAFCSPES